MEVFGNGIFEELNGIVMGTLGEYILKNQRLCKLLYYYPDDQRPNYDPFIQPDIEDTSNLCLLMYFQFQNYQMQF